MRTVQAGEDMVEDHSGGYRQEREPQGEDEVWWKGGEEEAVDGFSQEDPNNPVVSPHKTVMVEWHQQIMEKVLNRYMGKNLI